MNCPKCGYVRRQGTKVREGQCPFCGIFYEQYKGPVRSAPAAAEPQARSGAGGFVSLAIGLLVAAGLATAFFAKPDWLQELGGGERFPARAVSAPPPVRVAELPQARPQAKPPEAARRGIIMYSLTTCGYCKRMRQKFEANNIPFTEYFVDVDQARFFELTQKMQAAGYMGGGIGTPTLDVNGVIMPNNPPFEDVLRQARS